MAISPKEVGAEKYSGTYGQILAEYVSHIDRRMRIRTVLPDAYPPSIYRVILVTPAVDGTVREMLIREYKEAGWSQVLFEQTHSPYDTIVLTNVLTK